MSPSYIDGGTALADGVARWARSGIVAIDTEFIRTRTFYPIPALYQVAAGDELALIDPLGISEWHPFVGLLADDAVTKVMHACSEDVEVFVRHFGLIPKGIVDTQIAAPFVTGEFSPGYASLVQRFAGVVLEKHETRSDWLSRPLTDRQLEYAAEDVRYLLPVYRAMCEQLEASERMAWFLEENARRVPVSTVAPEAYYRQLGGAWRLDRRALARLRALCEWREQQARERDLPRRRVLEDDVLLRLAEAHTLTVELIAAKLPAKVARRHGALLMELAAEANALAEDACPALLEPPLEPREAQALRALKEVGRSVAEALGIAEELLVRRRELEATIRCHRSTGRLPDVFDGWRRPLVAERYTDILRASFGADE